MKIAISSDHAAVALKNEVCSFLNNVGDYSIFDLGGDDSLDYPDFARLVCVGIQKGNYDFGVLLCGTGIGMSIAANKFHKIRAALCNDMFTARLSREHNDANVLCMGARVLGVQYAQAILDTFLRTHFLGGRHKTRVQKIMAIEAYSGF